MTSTLRVLPPAQRTVPTHPPPAVLAQQPCRHHVRLSQRAGPWWLGDAASIGAVVFFLPRFRMWPAVLRAVLTAYLGEQVHSDWEDGCSALLDTEDPRQCVLG